MLKRHSLSQQVLPMTVSIILIQLHQGGLINLLEFMPVITVVTVMRVTEQLLVTMKLLALMLTNVPMVYKLQVQLIVVKEHVLIMMAVTLVIVTLDMNSTAMQLLVSTSTSVLLMLKSVTLVLTWVHILRRLKTLLVFVRRQMEVTSANFRW